MRGFYRGLMFMPMIMPDLVLGIGLLIFFVTAGFQLGLTTIVIGHCTFLASYVFIIVQARIAGMDRTLEEASADLGANEMVTMRRIILPQLAPGIIGGALLAFIISMDDLVITYFIAGVDSTTLPLFIFSMLRRGVKPEINAADAPPAVLAAHRVARPVPATTPVTEAAMTKPRARDLGLPFPGTPGPLNAITDVPGVMVGYSTILAERGKADHEHGSGPVRTGVTAILPRGRDPVPRPVWAGQFSLNGNDER